MHTATWMAIFELSLTLVVAQTTQAPAVGADPFNPFGNAVQPPPLVAEPPPPPAPFHSHAGEPLANANLPEYLQAEPGKLTLFADFDHPEKRGIPLYLINRTGKSIRFDCQDGDVYIKLERQTPDGQWERAQTHQFSDCGNSYNRELLMPGMHFRMRGYQPAQGEPARVRYVSYGSEACASNTGEGLYTPMDVKASQMDGITSRRSIGAIHSQFNPASSVKEPKIESRVAILKMAEQLGESPSVRISAAQWLKELETTASPTGEQRLALPIVRETLRHNWGAPKGHNPLLQMCLDAVKPGENSKLEFGNLKKYPEIAWKVIQSIARIEASHFPDLHDLPKTDNTLWKEAMMLAAAQVLKAPESTARSMTELLSVSTLVNDFLPDDVLEPFLAVESYALSNMAVHALARRSRWERLAELGFKLEAERQLIVLLALVQGPYYDDGNAALYGVGGLRTSPEFGTGDQEKAFWLHVIEEQPVKAACALHLFISNDHNPFNSTTFQALEAYWRKEAENSDLAGKDFELKGPEYEYRLALYFLATLRNDKERVPLLRSLLSHHGYIKQEGTIDGKPYSKQEFVVRRAAAEALQKKGEPLPSNLVLELDVTPTVKKNRTSLRPEQ